MAKINRNIGSQIIQKFDKQEDAQSRIDKLESEGRTIITGYFSRFENKWIIHFR